jgi:hypothetical protein
MPLKRAHVVARRAVVAAAIAALHRLEFRYDVSGIARAGERAPDVLVTAVREGPAVDSIDVVLDVDGEAVTVCMQAKVVY